MCCAGLIRNSLARMVNLISGIGLLADCSSSRPQLSGSFGPGRAYDCVIGHRSRISARFVFSLCACLLPGCSLCPFPIFHLDLLFAAPRLETGPSWPRFLERTRPPTNSISLFCAVSGAAVLRKFFGFHFLRTMFVTVASWFLSASSGGISPPPTKSPILFLELPKFCRYPQISSPPPSRSFALNGDPHPPPASFPV